MATAEPHAVQPKISQKLMLRTAIGLFSLAILFYGYRYFEGLHGDFDFGSANTAGIIAAVQAKDDGNEAVLIRPDGTIAGTSSWKSGAHDSDVVWSPDGRFVFFTSDRDGKTFQVYRWNPDKDDAASRTLGTGGRNTPTFSAQKTTDQNDTMLIISRGVVQSLDPKREVTPQVLPPTTANITQGGSEEGASGAENEFQARYGAYGNAFRYARWCFDNNSIAAIIEREGGDLLLIQDMQLKDGKLPDPRVVGVGSHIDFDVSPKDGSVIYEIQNFKFADPDHVPPQFIKDNKAVRPFAHELAMVTSDGKPVLIGASPTDKMAFGPPVVSPDGSTALVTAGTYDPSTDSLASKGLIIVPLQQAGMRLGSPLVQGDVHEPAWSPDGETIAFAMNANGKRDIYTIHKDGSSQTNLTAGKGDFRTPKFSPQAKAAS